MTWLDELLAPVLARIPPPRFGPDVTFSFEEVRGVIEITEHAIDRLKEQSAGEFKRRLDDALADPNFNFVERGLFRHRSAELWATEMTFPLILRRSLFIAICSHVEHVLRRWCEWLHGRWKLSRDLDAYAKKVKGPDIVVCVNHLREEARLAVGPITTWYEWQRIDGYRAARNCLAHDGGIVKGRDLVEKVEAPPQIQVDTSGIVMRRAVVHLLPGACEAAAENAKGFFNKLTAIAEADPRAKKR